MIKSTLVGLLVHVLVLQEIGAEFNPGCSFNDGQCMYNVQLGHHNQCDNPRDSGTGTNYGTGTTSTQCCQGLQTQLNGLSSDVALLKTQITTMQTELASSKQNSSDSQNALTEAQSQTQLLLTQLAQKELELNASQANLAKVLSDAGAEIRSLRDKLNNATVQLNACRGNLGLATNTSSFTQSSVLPDDINLDFCDFENLTDSSQNASSVTCGYDNPRGYFHRESGHTTSSTGPVEDHTLGSPKGHYMMLDTQDEGQHFTSSSLKEFFFTSKEYPPGPGYCIKFWYNMFGHDVQDLHVYAQVGSGNGYPIFSRHGDQSQEWHLAEIDLDQEYTSHPFKLKFGATSNAYYSEASYSSYKHYYNPYGDIAFDDIYVYNTPCRNIPMCPPGGVTFTENNMTSCYTFHLNALTWYQAASECRKLGATTSLVAITSQKEQNFLVSKISTDPTTKLGSQAGFWTAGNDERIEKTFDWTDSGTPYHSHFSNWKEGQPNNVANDQDCLLLEYPESNYQWGDEDCDGRHPYICETVYPTIQAPNPTANVLVG